MRRAPALLALAVSAAAAAGCGSTWSKRSPSATQAAGGAVSVFPSPGTPVVSPTTEISFRGIDPGKIGRISVVGSESGRHSGRLVAHRDGEGASFLPSQPFVPGEHVSVGTKLNVRGASGGTFAYTVARPVRERLGSPPRPTTPRLLTTFASQPGLRLTRITVTKRSRHPAPGLIFVAPRRGVGEDGLEVLDGAGEVVWFRPLPRGLQATDFREQTYEGKPVLTWWQGMLGKGHGYGTGVIANEHYRTIATVKAGDGYQADLHEFQLTSANTAFVTAYRLVRWDLSSVGGPRDGTVFDCVVQEVEVGTGRVLFEWHSLGNVPLSSTYQSVPGDGSPLDYFHVNSISSDDRGDVLVSSRATHTIYDIDGQTGAILWRLGGKHSDFRLGAGVRFHSQHDAKWLDASTITIFDNGAGVGGNDEKRSRGIVVRLDRQAHRATLVQQFPQPLGKLFASQGNVEKLPNGNWFVGWGEGPYANELAPDGSVVLGLHFASGQSYRAYKYVWHGSPTTAPSVAVTAGGVAASWNGATEVARWQLLTGGDPDHLIAARTTPKTGFETSMPLPGAPAYVAVRALAADGRTLATSKALAVESRR